jgi:hypothetical protein
VTLDIVNLNTLPAYMIVVKGNHISESYAEYCIPKWESLGYSITRIDAYTPDNIPSGPLKFKKNYSNKYVMNGGRGKIFSQTEMAIWYSHYMTWQIVDETQTPSLILEHDSIPNDNNIINWNSRYDFCTYDIGAMGAYVINPNFVDHIDLEMLQYRWIIDIGPFGYIHRASRFSWKTRLKCIFRDSPEYVHRSTQVVDERLGWLNDRYTGTEFENVYHEDYANSKLHKKVVLDNI